MNINIKPFREGDTFSTFRNIIEKTNESIRSLENEYVLNSSPTELDDYYVNEVLLEPLILHSDQKYIKKQSGVKIDISRGYGRDFYFDSDEKVYVKGTKILVAIPFEGDPVLWRIRPSTYTMSGYPTIDIGYNEIVIEFSFPDNSANGNNLKSDIDSSISSLENAIGNLRRDVEQHNNSAPEAIKQTLKSKRELAESTVGAIASLGIPIKRSDSVPKFTIPAQRRGRPTKPKVSTKSYQPEPSLDEKEYLHILEIMKSMSLVIERNPSSFSSLDEESIRDHFLLQLNGHYDGGATGETFNAAGKTDILIREGNKNVFIAECKFWHGQKHFKEAIDQLLSYLTWRDSKTALLIFNRTKDSNAVREKMHKAMQEVSEYRKTESYEENGDSKYILVKGDEPGKDIIVTTQLYDIPCKAS